MDPGIVGVVLPAVLALVMFGLGLSLTAADFARVVVAPRAVLVTLACQVVVMPAVCFALVLALGTDPHLALGMMVLAASPGGVMAAVFSRLAGGDVALNVTVTAVNSVLALLTVPVVVALAVGWFTPEAAGADGGIAPTELGRVAVVVLVPVALGMVVRRVRPAVADRLDRPVRIASLITVFLAIVAAVGSQLDGFVRGLASLGTVTLTFSVLSLAVGYAVPRLVRIGRRQAVAASMELGVHNAVFAITVATTVVGDPRAALAPAMYGALMFGPPAVLAAVLARRNRAAGDAAGGDAPGPAAAETEAGR